jgi:hypothetical protein
MLDAGYWMLDLQLDTGYWHVVIGYWIFDYFGGV